jgi:hypothetical protein
MSKMLSLSKKCTYNLILFPVRRKLNPSPSYIICSYNMHSNSVLTFTSRLGERHRHLHNKVSKSLFTNHGIIRRYVIISALDSLSLILHVCVSVVLQSGKSKHCRLHKKYLLSYLLLSPWSRVLPEKLIGLQLVKKFPAFYGTLRFITTFTSARHLSLSWASSIQSISHIPLPEDLS